LDVKKRFSEEQIIGFLREAEAGMAGNEGTKVINALPNGRFGVDWSRPTVGLSLHDLGMGSEHPGSTVLRRNLSHLRRAWAFVVRLAAWLGCPGVKQSCP
jgi:hypothetical protein